MITATTGVTQTLGSSRSTGSSNDLGKDAFLMLLITQLRNQDPMSPMEDKEFIAQLAQFSSLEQMQTMNSKLEPLAASFELFAKSQSAAGMIGRTITATDPNPPIDVRGHLINPKLDSAGHVLRNADGSEIAMEISGKVDSIQFKDGAAYVRISVQEKRQDQLTGEYVTVTAQKDVPVGDVLSVM